MRPLGGPAAGAQRWMQRIQPVRSQPPTLSSPGQFLPGYCTHVWSRPFSLVATPYSNGRLLFYQANTRAYTFPAVEGWEGRMPTVLEIAGCSYLPGSLIELCCKIEKTGYSCLSVDNSAKPPLGRSARAVLHLHFSPFKLVPHSGHKPGHSSQHKGFIGTSVSTY